MFKKVRKNKKGFTLVELLVVIAIIGILAVVAVPSLFKNINKAKAADAIAYISAVKTEAISQYAEDEGAVTTETVLAGIDGGAPEGVLITGVSIDSGTDKCTVVATVPSSILDKVNAEFGAGSGVTVTSTGGTR